MLIDWFTVIAQLINFLILVWLLKRFLYQPILQVMDEREKRITNRLQEAEAQKAEALKEKGHFQELNSNLEQQRETLLNQAKADANSERQRLLEEAREDHRLLRARLQETLDSEKANLSQGILRRFQEEVFEIARKVLADLADSSLEQQMAAVFARRLAELSDGEGKQLTAALQASSHPVTVRSTFTLSSEQQAAIKSALKKMLPPDGQVLFEATSATPANGQAQYGQADGIELTTNGYKMAWSITDYLGDLEQKAASILEAEPAQEQKSKNHGG